MKKITALILAVLMVLSLATTSFANESYQELKTLKIIPNEITESNQDELMTREVFAFMAAKLLGSGELKAQPTAFLDVDETNIYSGYIAYLNQNAIISGGGDGNFNPKDPVTVGAASKILTTILDYDALAEGRGGYAGGYEAVARMIGLMKGVGIKDNFLTVASALKMVDNALSTPMAANEYFIGEGGAMGNISQSGNATILSKLLKLNVYSVYVNKVNDGKASVTIIENKEETNPVMLEEGTEKTFLFDGSVNAAAFKYAPATIVVNEDETIVSMSLAKNVEAKTTVIRSVNGDENEKSYAYIPSKIERLTIDGVEDEYTVAEDARFYYNEKLTTSGVKLIGKPARVIISNDEVVCVESWDLEEGGLITAVDLSQIVYSKGEKTSIKLSKLDQYKNVSVYIDGRSATLLEIKTNSVFDYWASDDTLVIVVSESVYVDTFMSLGDKEIEIGGIAILTEDNVYYKAGSYGFKKNAGFEPLFTNTVRAYLAPNGKVRYVELLDGATNTNNKFLGVLIGHEEDEYDDKNTLSLKVMKLTPSPEEKIYEMTDKTRFTGGVTKSSFLASAQKISSEYVYEFELRADGKIASVKKATWYFGYGDTAETKIGTDTGSVVNHFQQAEEGIQVNGKVFYFKNQLTLVDKVEGKITAKKYNHSTLVGNFVSCKIALFVLSDNSQSSLPDLIFVYSSVDGQPMNFKYYKSKSGIVYDKTRIVDEEGEIRMKVTGVFGGQTKTIYLTEEQAKDLTDLCYISYSDIFTLEKSDVTISQVKDLTMPFAQWPVADSSTAAGWHRGTVETIDQYRLGTVDDSGVYDANFYAFDGSFFLEADISGNKPLISSSSSNKISIGDQVYFNLTSEGITGVIVVKE